MSAAVVHLVATAFMAGVIVFVQVVHYPLMRHVDVDGFAAFEAAHTSRTAWVVAPPMIVELVMAIWLFAGRAALTHPAAASVGLGLVAAIWMSTALVQAPAHGRLSRGFDPAIHRRLVRSNWVRTAAWVARVPIAVALIY